ncbi:hypothetical protein Pla123a_14500 [Posidoniimonas polymericola]|uniref:DUF2314 domain-containing protein n=1 Tax=Posidoniimonas polymericola TaxID=2528002 RepID=A0A5C5YRQ8_9BACT|nr:DUF2314 domain-containing protein [Posidoniimonas polymericola]TWT77654.1 hypothetical protein Pla123a_14500 [Posidoniimonas polymericola]
MASDSDDLVPYFMPALVAVLVHAEDEKGSPLTKDEVHSIRDNAACIMMEVGDARRMDDSRGYRDVDPENCWHDWQVARREMGRQPDLDPGPRFYHARADDPAYQQTIRDAQESLVLFRQFLPVDGTPRPDALVKTRITDGDNSALMWLNYVAVEGDNFSGEFFEVPDEPSIHKVGDRHTVAPSEVLDWMVNQNGRISGGFSLRYQRAQMSDAEQIEFDRHIGATDYI